MASFLHCFGLSSLQDFLIPALSFLEPRRATLPDMSYLTPKPKHLDEYAVFTAREYFTLRGFHVERVPGGPGAKCFDLTAKQNGVTLKVAVKGSTRLWDIPVLDPKTFNAKRRLVADFLYVVYFSSSQKPTLCAIPRDALTHDLILGSPGHGFHLSARFTKPRTLRPFLHPL